MSRSSSRSRTLTRGGTLVAALAALALVTAGCGGGSGSSGGSSKTRGVTITVALASDAPPKAVLGEFTKVTGIKVKWVNIDWDSLQTKISAAATAKTYFADATDVDWSQQPEWWAGGHGLYSTPTDYLRFQRMLLSGGTLDGAKILERATVEEAFRNQIGELDFPEAIKTADPSSSDDFNAGPGYKWGYGLLLNTEDIPGMRRAYSGAWAGLLNTHFWVDRSTGVTGAIYTQFLPFVTPEAFGMYQDFERALYASL